MNGPRSILEPLGPQAERIADLWWLFFWVCAAVYVLVFAALAAAVVRRRAQGRAAAEPGGPIPEADQRRLLRGVGTATGVTIVLLFVFLIASVSTGRKLTLLPREKPLTLRVVGHQWWWEVHYEDPAPINRVETANEIHIPAGQPVLILLQARDVIHSFWVPSLHGKMDLIPGTDNAILVQADRPGVYRGQCAEYCGHQHAHMGLLMIAEPPGRFQAWLAAQRRPARKPATPAQLRGQQLVEALPCANCHTIRGTQAGGSTGPDLTHFGSRRTIGAATLPNTRGHLGGWIVDSQAVKPGNRMPPNLLDAESLQAVLDYLESLK